MIYRIDELRKGFTEERFSPAYFFSGDEEYLKEELIQVLHKTFINDNWAVLDRVLYYGGEASIGDVIQSLLTPPIASKRKLIILRDLHKLKENEKKELLQYVKNPQSESCLVMIVPKVNLKEGFYGQLSRYATSCIFYKPFDWNLPKWVKEYISQKGYTMEEKALRFFLETTFTDLGNLANELEKIILYVGEKKRISLQDLSFVMGHSRRNDVFHLTKAIGKGDVAQGLRFLENLLLWNERPTVILAMIARHFFLLLKTKDLLEMKIGRPKMAVQLGIRDFFLKDYIQQSSHYTRENLRRGLQEIYQLERRIKSGREKGVLALECLILHFCQTPTPISQ